MKAILAICFTAILIAAGHEYAGLLRVQAQIEWNARIEMAKQLHEEMMKRAPAGDPKVETPTDKPKHQSLEKL